MKEITLNKYIVGRKCKKKVKTSSIIMRVSAKSFVASVCMVRRAENLI